MGWQASGIQTIGNTGKLQASPNRQLLVVAHTPSPNTQALCDAVLRGAMHPDIDHVEVRHVRPLQAEPEDVLWAHAIVLGTTENFGYMSGALKDFFDRIYYPCLEHTEGLPYAAPRTARSRPRSLRGFPTGRGWAL